MSDDLLEALRGLGEEITARPPDPEDLRRIRRGITRRRRVRVAAASGVTLLAVAAAVIATVPGSASKATVPPASPSATVVATTPPPTVTAPSSTVPPATTAPPATTPPPVTSAPPPAVPAGYTEAKALWVRASTALSYQQSGIWSQAATDLGEAVAQYGSTRTPGYSTAAAELRQIASLPDAMLTPEQTAEANRDTAALNKFFGTPGLYAAS